MKFIICTCLLFAFSSVSKAQNVAINNTGALPDSSAMLDVKSDTKGILIPRTRRSNVINPKEGLLVFDLSTKTFWYYSNNAWHEIPNNTIGAIPGGNASGDLYGNYPAPNVGKIQNLDVAFGVPFDKQALKWDQLNNRWQGQNDSLFLPYNVTFGSSTNLFGITNANTSTGSSAIYGKSSNAGSGISLSSTAGIWGDNNTGAGVAGTSNNGVGTYGYSVNNHGAYGFTGNSNFAAVYGSRINNGPIVMGDLYNAGIAIYGKSNGLSGKAALFENTNSANVDTVAKFIQHGIGLNAHFLGTNGNNISPLITVEHYGKGAGMRMFLHNSQNSDYGMAVNQFGNGTGLYVGSEKSKVAEFYSNALNTDTAVYIRQDGTGAGVQLNLNNTANTRNAFTARTNGTGAAGFFVVNNISNNNAALSVTTNGTGEAINVVKTNTGSNIPAINGTSLGTTGIAGYGREFGIFGFATATSGGIGILGQASAGDITGIGVKGISNSTNFSSGAVTGINNVSGIGVLGTSQSGSGVMGTSVNGTGVYAVSYGTNEYGLLAEAGILGAQSHAALFRNPLSSNTRQVVEIENEGTGNELYIKSMSTIKASSVIRITNAGLGKFLSFQNASGIEKFTVSSLGDVAAEGGLIADSYVVTGGTVTVKGDKGIVRNSTSTQMRMQELTVTVPAGSLSAVNEFIATFQVSVSFSPAFSAIPAVYPGNIVIDGGVSNLTVFIRDVTTSGFTFNLRNFTSKDFTWTSSSFKILVVGPE